MLFHKIIVCSLAARLWAVVIWMNCYNTFDVALPFVV